MAQIGQLLNKIETKEDIIRQQVSIPLSDAMQLFIKIASSRTRRGFIIDKDNIFVIENLIKWALADNTTLALDPITRKQISGNLTKGIYIAGPAGTGKSLILNTLSEFLFHINAKAMFGNSVKQLAYPIYTTTQVCKWYADMGDLSYFFENYILCFQDLGAEQIETLYMGTRTRVMTTILQERGDKQGQITLISSNNSISDQDTITLYGDRIERRLRGLCNYFELVGKDRTE